MDHLKNVNCVFPALLFGLEARLLCFYAYQHLHAGLV